MFGFTVTGGPETRAAGAAGQPATDETDLEFAIQEKPRLDDATAAPAADRAALAQAPSGPTI
jgi:hypothetical protein